MRGRWRRRGEGKAKLDEIAAGMEEASVWGVTKLLTGGSEGDEKAGNGE